jgi:hypothetical protein
MFIAQIADPGRRLLSEGEQSLRHFAGALVVVAKRGRRSLIVERHRIGRSAAWIREISATDFSRAKSNMNVLPGYFAAACGTRRPACKRRAQ